MGKAVEIRFNRFGARASITEGDVAPSARRDSRRGSPVTQCRDEDGRLCLPGRRHCGYGPRSHAPRSRSNRHRTHGRSGSVTTATNEGRDSHDEPSAADGMRCVRVAVLLIPPLLWVGVVLVAPTDWAKRHVVAALEAANGSLGSPGASVGAAAGRRSTDGPGNRLTADDRRSLAQDGEPPSSTSACSISSAAISGPRSVEVDGVNLRVLRRADGTLELADLILPEREASRPCPTTHRDPARLRRSDSRREP